MTLSETCVPPTEYRADMEDCQFFYRAVKLFGRLTDRAELP